MPRNHAESLLATATLFDRCAPGERCCAITRAEDLLLHALNTVGRWRRHIPRHRHSPRHAPRRDAQHGLCAARRARLCEHRRVQTHRLWSGGWRRRAASRSPTPRRLPRRAACRGRARRCRRGSAFGPRRWRRQSAARRTATTTTSTTTTRASTASCSPRTNLGRAAHRGVAADRPPRAAAAAGRRARVRRRRGAARGGGARGAGAVAAPPFGAHDGRPPLLARLRRPPRHLRPPLRRARAAAAAARPAALRARPPERRARRRVERAGGERQGDARRARLPLRGGGAAHAVPAHGTVARAPARDAARVLRSHRGVRGVARRPLRVGAAHAHRHRLPRTRPPALPRARRRRHPRPRVRDG